MGWGLCDLGHIAIPLWALIIHNDNSSPLLSNYCVNHFPACLPETSTGFLWRLELKPDSFQGP